MTKVALNFTPAEVLSNCCKVAGTVQWPVGIISGWGENTQTKKLQCLNLEYKKTTVKT